MLFMAFIVLIGLIHFIRLAETDVEPGSTSPIPILVKLRKKRAAAMDKEMIAEMIT